MAENLEVEAEHAENELAAAPHETDGRS